MTEFQKKIMKKFKAEDGLLYSGTFNPANPDHMKELFDYDETFKMVFESEINIFGRKEESAKKIAKARTESLKELWEASCSLRSI